MAAKTKQKAVKRGQCGPLPPRNDPPTVVETSPPVAKFPRWSMRLMPFHDPSFGNGTAHNIHVYDGNEHVATFKHQKFATAFVAVMTASER